MSAQPKPNSIVRGPFFPEPVQVIVILPMGDSVKLVGKGLRSGQVTKLFCRRSNWHYWK